MHYAAAHATQTALATEWASDKKSTKKDCALDVAYVARRKEQLEWLKKEALGTATAVVEEAQWEMDDLDREVTREERSKQWQTEQQQLQQEEEREKERAARRQRRLRQQLRPHDENAENDHHDEDG
jgi:hypothetical protein